MRGHKAHEETLGSGQLQKQLPTVCIGKSRQFHEKCN